MKRVSVATAIGMASAGMLLGSAANGASLVSIAAATGATLNNGFAPASGLLFGTVTGGFEASGKQLTPFVTIGVGPPNPYDFSIDAGLDSTAGDARDFRWVHETSAPPAVGPFAAVGTMFSFGAIFGQSFILDPSVDHLPIPDEALEATLWGSADGGSTWTKGILAEIFTNGWSAGSIEDQPSSRWSFAFPVNMISATGGFSQGSFVNSSFDAEIDAISMVVPLPTPLGMGLAGMGVLAFGVRRRRTH